MVFPKLKLNLKRKAPTILSFLAVFGVGMTAVTAVKAKPKADERIDKAREEKGEELTTLETIKAAAPAYIQSIAIGFGTSACILGANVLNKKTQASITTAYALLHNQYVQYINEVRKECGEELHQKIMSNIAPKRDPYIFCCDWTSALDMQFDPKDEHEVLFYDIMSKRYFKTTPSKFVIAVYNLNRNFVHGLSCSKNDFYGFLGIDPVGLGDGEGWSLDDLFWIDFEMSKEVLDNGTLECYVIQPRYGPEPFPTE